MLVQIAVSISTGEIPVQMIFEIGSNFHKYKLKSDQLRSGGRVLNGDRGMREES